MDLSRRCFRLSLGLTLVFALAIRLAAAFWWQGRLEDDQFAFPDSHSYWVMSRALARGEPFQYGSPESRMFRMPGYPVLLAPLFLLGDNPPVIWARILGAVCGTFAVAGVAEITRRLFDERTSLVAAVWSSLYPGAIGMSVFVLSEALFCPLMVLNLLLWIVAWRTKRSACRWTAAAASGLAAGAATLARPSWLLFVPFALLLTLVFSPWRRRHLAMGAVILAGLVVAMTPWWIRNYRIAGRFVPTTLQMGATLYDSLRPGATGASDAGMQFVDEFMRQQFAADAASVEPLDSTFEYRLDRRMREAALAWAREHPGEVLRLSVVKLVRTWSPLPHADELQSWPMRIAVAGGYLPILVLGILGGWRHARRGWPYVLCLMPAIYFSCLHAVFVGSIRYRQPAMLLLIVLASAAAVSLLSRRSRDEWEEPACVD